MNTAVDRMLAIGRKPWMRRHRAPTFVFADLAGYTALTEKRGDLAAAELARVPPRDACPGAQARRLAGQVDGRWRDDLDTGCSRGGRACGHAVQEIGTAPELLPVRVGVHTGPAVMRGLDWYGSTVNVAARLADQAEPNQALISGTTVQAAMGELSRPPKARREILLHGFDRPIVAWRLT